MIPVAELVIFQSSTTRIVRAIKTTTLYLTEDDKKKQIAQGVAKELGVLYGKGRILLHGDSCQVLADTKTALKVPKT